MEPLSMALLASLTPPGIEVRFYDDRLDDIPFDEPTDLVAISVETFTALRAYKIAREFRGRGVPVVMGGYHATLLPDEVAAEADAVVVGDAEPIWAELLDDARHRRLGAATTAWVGAPWQGFDRGGRCSPVNPTRGLPWSSSLAAVISSATSARSPPSTMPARTTGRPVR